MARKRSAASSKAGAPRRRTQKRALALSIPSQTTFLALVREITKKMAEAAGFEDAVPDQLALAVDEATTNAIEHAYRGDPNQVVIVQFEDRGADFRVEVIDTGAMMDPRSVPRVDLARYASERRKGGLGVHLMENIMDSVTFRRSARRNVCLLIKHKDGGGEGGA